MEQEPATIFIHAQYFKSVSEFIVPKIEKRTIALIRKRKK